MDNGTFYAIREGKQTDRIGERVETVGATVMRCGLALIFLWFGAMKFTSYEASGTAHYIMHSPLIGWLYAHFSIQGTSDMLGVFEISTGVLLLAGFFTPLLSAVGGAMGVIVFLTTLSFFFTTPGVGEPLARRFPALSAKPGQFLLKDLGLLGISVFILGASLLRARSSAAGGLASNYASADKISALGASNPAYRRCCDPVRAGADLRVVRVHEVHQL